MCRTKVEEFEVMKQKCDNVKKFLTDYQPLLILFCQIQSYFINWIMSLSRTFTSRLGLVFTETCVIDTRFNVDKRLANEKNSLSFADFSAKSTMIPILCRNQWNVGSSAPQYFHYLIS